MFTFEIEINRLRKNTIILFFVALIVLQAFINCLFEIAKECHKENIIENVLSKLPTNYLTKVNAINSNIIWIENGKEFVLNGEMYDVVTIEKLNNNTIYYCFSDKDEDALLKKYDELNNQNKPINSSKQLHHFSTIDIFCTALPLFDNITLNAASISVSPKDKSFLYPTFSADIVIPPPQNC